MDEKFLKFKKRYEETYNLVDDAYALAKALRTEYDRDHEYDTYHDWDFLCWRVIRNDLHPLLNDLVIESRFRYLKARIRENVSDEKVRFNSEKIYRAHLRELILPKLESLINSSKMMKFNDYRVQRFQQRMGEVMQELKSAYDEILGEDEKS